MSEEEPNDVKVILLGESGIGKTSLINVTIGQEFREEENSTASSSFVTKKFEKKKQNIYFKYMGYSRTRKI